MDIEMSIGDVIAALALLLSGYATWRSHKFKRKEEDLLELQREVHSLILEKGAREATEASHANLSAGFVSIGNMKHRLKIFNKGKAAACNVSVGFPDGNNIVLESELHDKFPMQVMEPGQSVELVAAVHAGTKRKHAIRLRWADSDGKEQEKVVHATL